MKSKDGLDLHLIKLHI